MKRHSLIYTFCIYNFCKCNARGRHAFDIGSHLGHSRTSFTPRRDEEPNPSYNLPYAPHAPYVWTRNGTYEGIFWLSIKYNFTLCSCPQILTDTGTQEIYNRLIISAMRFGCRYVSAPDQTLEWEFWPTRFRKHRIDLRTGTLPGTNLASTASARGIERPSRFFRHRPANRTQARDPHASDTLSISVRP